MVGLHVNLERGLKIGMAKREVDFRRVGRLEVQKDPSYRWNNELPKSKVEFK